MYVLQVKANSEIKNLSGRDQCYKEKNMENHVFVIFYEKYCVSHIPWHKNFKNYTALSDGIIKYYSKTERFFYFRKLDLEKLIFKRGRARS